MKTTKLISLFLSLIMIFGALISCGESKPEEASAGPEATELEETEKPSVQTEGSVDTTAETGQDKKTSYEPAYRASSLAKYVEFDLPEDFRQTAVDYMLYQANIVWTPQKTIKTQEQFAYENWGIDLTYNQGEEYHGLPYANTYATVGEFEQFYLNDKRELVSNSSSWKGIPGLECASSIVMALQQFSYVYGYTNAFNPANQEFKAVKLGDYKVEPGQSSSEICKSNGVKGMYASYGLLDKGDVIFKGGASGSGNHVRMIHENKLVKKSDGSIDGHKSYVLCLEQTNAFDKLRKDDVKTTWYVDHKYTYEDLFTTSYIPSTLREYTDGRQNKIYIGISNEIRSSDLAQKALIGQVETNSTIRFVYMDIYSKDGELLKREVVHGVQDYNTNGISISATKIDLRKYAYNLFKDLEAGEYTFVLNAGVAAGNAELARVDFRIK